MFINLISFSSGYNAQYKLKIHTDKRDRQAKNKSFLDDFFATHGTHDVTMTKDTGVNLKGHF